MSRYFFISSLHVPAPQPAFAVGFGRAAAGATALLRSTPASTVAVRETSSSTGAALAVAVAAGLIACGAGAAGALDDAGSGDGDDGAAFEHAASDAIVSAAMNVSTESFGMPP